MATLGDTLCTGAAQPLDRSWTPSGGRGLGTIPSSGATYGPFRRRKAGLTVSRGGSPAGWHAGCRVKKATRTRSPVSSSGCGLRRLFSPKNYPHTSRVQQRTPAFLSIPPHPLESSEGKDKRIPPYRKSPRPRPPSGASSSAPQRPFTHPLQDPEPEAPSTLPPPPPEGRSCSRNRKRRAAPRRARRARGGTRPLGVDSTRHRAAR